MSPALLIVMGVSGCGKSTMGIALAKALGGSFQDADDLHPKSNVDKMSAGHPLTDADRIPWLTLVRYTAEQLSSTKTEGDNIIVIACSALKRSYRSILRGLSPESPGYLLPSEQSHSFSKSKSELRSPYTEESREEPSPSSDNRLKTYFLFIDGPRELLLRRMVARKGHFMKETMLDSQLTTLERPVLSPDSNEEGVDASLVEMML
ncbi:hypothetical protein BS47DRAFT_918553 [Hydnum rufescens UP504]|uniref:Gluconokinase n=1 Tax=Hydnum rufescens UP504 TaxID=1448309 RepID=A0A9P6B9G2_9AGAM|nr:hypothetical protein BS47DRAFT_918553 [Hydnum rufescens UP504]